VQSGNVSIIKDASGYTFAMMDKALGEFGCIDLLVNNAGIQHVAPVEDFPVEKWDAILAINLSSNFHAIQAALPAGAFRILFVRPDLRLHRKIVF
jgi:NAD(P)-dependent dehydrogenase (short-subunit alcohol dehydrogenase family)